MNSDSQKSFSVLFVCLGNICRSPLAEGVFLKLVEDEGLDEFFEVDSCGTGAWHVGEAPHHESQRVARQNSIDISSQQSRQVRPSDFKDFDYIFAMDSSNYSDLDAMMPKGSSARLHLMREFDPLADSQDVPDPFYGGASGFDHVFNMLERSCFEFLAALRKEQGI